MRTELKGPARLRFPDGRTFQLLRVIGSGGGALLYEAREEGTELYAAIKEAYPIRGFVRREGRILPERQEDAAALARLKEAMAGQEAGLSQQAGRRNHQVLPVRQVYHRADITAEEMGRTVHWRKVENTYALMDSLRVQGLTLGEYLHRRGGSLELDDALAVMATTVDGYAALHGDGFLHGDCQVNNLFLLRTDGAEGPGVACIIDFGSARRLQDGKTAPVEGDIFSTDGYCPPEILLRGREPLRLTAAADVWALGVLLLELLTGRALQGTEVTRFLMTHPREKRLTAGEYRRLGCSAAQRDLLGTILRRALDNDPARRYPDAGALREDLRRLRRCRKLDLSAGPDRYLLWEAALRWRERNPLLFRTEHRPVLVDALPVKKLVVQASLDGGRNAPAAELLLALAAENRDALEKLNRNPDRTLDEIMDLFRVGGEMPSSKTSSWQRKKSSHTYLHAPGGAGKSFVTAELMGQMLEKGPLVPLYLDLQRELPEEYDLPEEALAALLARQYLGREDRDTAGRLAEEFRGDERRYALVLDNLHKADRRCYGHVLEAINGACRNWSAVWVLVVGRSGEPALPGGEFLPEHRLALQPLPEKEVSGLIRTVQQERLAELKEGSDAWVVQRLSMGIERPERLRQFATLRLPLFFMRYLEVLKRQPEEITLIDGTAELMSRYFGGREYEANSREVHDFLSRRMPWVAYRWTLSRQAEQSRETILAWLEESWGRPDDRGDRLERFLHLAVDNLAILGPAGDGLRFAHDCYQEYFFSRAVAGRLKACIEERDPRRCGRVNAIWPDMPGRLWLDLCEADDEDGEYRRVRTTEEVLEQLYACLSENREAARQFARAIPGNVAKVLWKEKRWVPERDPHRWEELGAELGDPEMQYRLGEAVLTNETRNPALAEDWLTRAAEQGNVPARFSLGKLFWEKKRTEEALRWWGLAAEGGSEEGEYYHGAGSVLTAGEGKVGERALDWLFGRELEQTKRAHLYRPAWRRGDLWPAKEKELLAKLEQAAERGDRDAMYFMGVLYEEGRMVVKSIPWAMDWYRRAAKLQQPDAQLRLGEMYLLDKGMTQNTELAMFWFTRAAQERDAAEEWLRKLQEAPTPEEPAEEPPREPKIDDREWVEGLIELMNME